MTQLGQDQLKVRKPSTYVRDMFSLFSLWEDVLGNSLPGSWSLPAPVIASLATQSWLKMPPHSRRQASGWCFPVSGKWAPQGAWGQEAAAAGQAAWLRRVGLGGRGQRAKGLRKVTGLLEKLPGEMCWKCRQAHERKEWTKWWGRTRSMFVRACGRDSKALIEMLVTGQWGTWGWLHAGRGRVCEKGKKTTTVRAKNWDTYLVLLD